MRGGCRALLTSKQARRISKRVNAAIILTAMSKIDLTLGACKIPSYFIFYSNKTTEFFAKHPVGTETLEVFIIFLCQRGGKCILFLDTSLSFVLEGENYGDQDNQGAGTNRQRFAWR